MRTATQRWIAIAAVLAVAMVGVSVRSAVAFGPLPLDHYKIYDATTTDAVFAEPVILVDQFNIDGLSGRLDGPFRFGVPTDKNDEGIFDPSVHYTWYRVNEAQQQPIRTVVFENQFGVGVVDVRQPRWLLSPANKNQMPGSPLPDLRDHFLCYDAAGDELLRNVILDNQFGFETHILLKPDLFCNPVQKEHNGVIFPIINEIDHLVCYQFEHPDSLTLTVTTEDQFVLTNLALFQSIKLCVPSLKTGVTPTEDNSTWGRLKSIYR